MLSRPLHRRCDRASRRRRCGVRPRPGAPPRSSRGLAGPAVLPHRPHQSNNKAGLFFLPACGRGTGSRIRFFKVLYLKKKSAPKKSSTRQTVGQDFFKTSMWKRFRIKNYEDFEQCVNRVFWVYFFTFSFLSSVLKFNSYTDENAFKIFCLKKKVP
jgi:hypothetical protein